MAFRWILISAILLLPNFALAANSDQFGASQDQAQKAQSSTQQPAATNINEPVFTGYRGVSIGMTATEIREKLGNPKLKDKSQDLFRFADNESAQFFYDAQEKVYAISIDFTGNGAPTAREVLGEDITARADGSMYRMKQYPTAGYWVSYSRTNSTPPHITITMQKIGR